jgi:hypothetical protein
VEGVAAGGGALEVCAGGGRAEQKGSGGGQRRKKADRSQKDSFVNPKKSRDPSVKENFPLIQNPNEENV